MGHPSLRSMVLTLGTTLILATAGCSGSSSPLAPTPQETRTVGNGTNVTYATSGVQVVAAEDSFATGDSVDLGVVLDPSDLPQQARNPAIHEKVASVVLSDVDDSGVGLLNPLGVRVPLRNKDGIDNNTSLRLFQFDFVEGRWIDTTQSASIADNSNSAFFSATELGTYGLFRILPLKVSISPTRTNGRAPFSVGLTASITGGQPPYQVIWYYGDDSTPDVGHTVSHIYEDPITYHCTATVTDAAGATVSAFVDLRAY